MLVPHWLLSALFGSAVVSLTVLPHVRRRHLTAIGDASEPRTAQPAIPERRMASGAAPPAAARSLHDREDDDDRRMGIVRRPASTGRAPEPATVTVLAAGAFAQAVEQARRSVALEGGVYRIRRELYGRQPDARASLRRTAELTITDDKIAWLGASGRHRGHWMPVRSNGLAYDVLLAQHGDSGAAATCARVLEEQRAALAAAVALLLVRKDAAYRCRLATGLLACTASQLVLGKGNALYDQYLHLRRCVVAEQGSGLAAALPAVAGRPESDRLALLPAVVDGGAAYLVLAGTASPEPARGDARRWSEHTLIELLDLRP